MRNTFVPDCIPESIKGKKRIQPCANPVSNDLPSKQFQKYAEIAECLINPDIGKVRDTDHIGSQLIKFLGHRILERLGIIELFMRLDIGNFGDLGDLFLSSVGTPTFR